MFRFAIIGAGGIAHKFCDAVRLAGHEVTAVASKSAERAAEFAAKENIAYSFGDYAEMLDSVKPDAVYIATTHNFHYDNIMLCLERGLPVICEKPMVLTAEEARRVFDAAKRRGVFVMEAMWSRFLPQIKRAREWICDGRIGKPELLDSIVAFRSEYNPASRIYSRELAGGAAWDVGVYAYELATYLLGEYPLEMQSLRLNAPNGTDRTVSVNLRFSDCLATVKASVYTPTPLGIYIGGHDGYIRMPHANTGCEGFLYDSSGSLVEHFREEYPNGFLWEVEETVRCVREGRLESPVIPWADTLNCAEFFDFVLSR